jgi:chitinase
VKEIAEKGVPLNKIVVGKPVNQSDATNTGWMDHFALAQAVKRASEELGWKGGVMLWQYSSDSNGSVIAKIAGGLL